jgi:ABC-2 type transport system ATP-binding protein
MSIDEQAFAVASDSRRAAGLAGAAPAVEVERLVKRYGEKVAVAGISFTVARGEVFGLLGPNGAGKTTTIEIITGLRQPDAGRVRVLGLEHGRHAAAIKERIGVQLQTPALFPLLTVYEVLDLFAGFFRHAAAPAEMIALLGLEESRTKLVKQLSGGQQQRLSVALALINHPELVFLDEPTSGLDPQARVALWEVIDRQRQEGRTVFLTTHYMEEAERLCDRVAIIDHGVIQALGAPRALIRQHFAETAIVLPHATLPFEVLRALPAVSAVEGEGAGVRLYSSNVPHTMAALLQIADARALEGLYVSSATLEDVFLKLTGRRLRE